MSVLARFFNVLPLSEGVSRLQDGSLPSRAVSITFDDGYADNYTLAWPVLRKLGLPWTIFVTTGYLDGGRMWNDTVIEAIEHLPGTELDLSDLGLGVHPANDAQQRAHTIGNVLTRLKHVESDSREELAIALAEKAGIGLSSNLMLSSSQLVELARSGVEIGAHTVKHPILKVVGADVARREITDSKDQLEKIIGEPVRAFAYPNGRPGQDYDDSHVELVRDAGFTCAVSTRPGVASHSSDVLQLPRFGPWDESRIRFALRLFLQRI